MHEQSASPESAQASEEEVKSCIDEELRAELQASLNALESWRAERKGLVPALRPPTAGEGSSNSRVELVVAALSMILFVFAVWVGRKIVVHYQRVEQQEQQQRIAESKDHFWMMEAPTPEGAIRFWLPETGRHADCFPQKYTRAEAMLEAVLLVQDGHFHVTRETEYGGFRLDEFLDDRDGKGEFWSGSVFSTHYHGIFLEEKNGRDLLQRLAPQQHGPKGEPNYY